MHRSSRVVTSRFEMFLLFSRPPSSRRLHTKLHKFGWNRSLNNWTVLDLGEVDDISMTYHIPDCSLHLLNDYYFCLWQRDSKNQQLNWLKVFNTQDACSLFHGAKPGYQFSISSGSRTVWATPFSLSPIPIWTQPSQAKVEGMWIVKNS